MQLRLVVLLAAAAGGAGCHFAPRLDADVEGLAAFLAQSSAGSPAALPRLPGGEERPEYRLGARDALSVVVWERPDLGSQPGDDGADHATVIAADGTVTLPLIGSVPVAGSTVAEAAAAIGERYAETIGLDPKEKAASALGDAGLAALAADAPRPAYRIGPLDAISIEVWGREDLGSQLPLPTRPDLPITLVEPDGAIHLPFVGHVDVAGLTVAEARDLLDERYSDEVTDPRVLVQVVEARSRPVQVAGEVGRRGTVLLDDAVLTLGETLDAAGGTTDRAAKTGFLARGEARFAFDVEAVAKGESEADVLLQAGDSVFVPTLAASTPLVSVALAAARSQSVVLSGEFNNPGVFHLNEDARTLGEVFTAAGGLTEKADTRNGVLTRNGERFPLDYRAAQEGLSDAHDLALEAGDRIFFGSSEDRLVHVIGEVRLQGAVPIPPKGLTLLEAILATGGTNPITADTEELYLVRSYPDAEAVICVFSLEELVTLQDSAAMPGDTIYVSQSWLAAWDRFWRQLLPFVTDSSFAYRNVDQATDD